MAATFDANATADTTANGATSVTSTALTVGSSANRALLIQFAFSLTTISALVVTWDFGASAQPCAVVTGATGNNPTTTGRAELWALVNPVSGAKTLKAAWTGASDVTMNGVSWSSVDQTGGATSFPHGTSANGNSGTASLAVTSATNNATVATVEGQGNLSAPTQTQTFLDNTPASISGGGSRAAGAATVTHQFTVTAAGAWVVVGCDILAFSVAAAGGAIRSVTRPFPFAPGSPPASSPPYR